MGSGTQGKSAEITSGRATLQQGLAATCEDLLTEAEAEGGRGGEEGSGA